MATPDPFMQFKDAPAPQGGADPFAQFSDAPGQSSGAPSTTSTHIPAAPPPTSPPATPYSPTFNDLATGGPSAMRAPEPGLSFADKTALAAHENLDEREMYLKKVYGKDKVKRQQDPHGIPYLTVDTGKGLARVGQERMGFFAETAASLPQLGGMGAGATIGAETGALGGPAAPFTVPLGALAGAALGAGIGYTGREAVKAATGTYAKTPQEEAKAAGKEAAWGAAGEAGGKILGKGIQKVLSGRLPSFITGATKESRAATEKAWQGGARPPFASMAPDARKLARIEVDAEKISGKYTAQDARNQAYVLNEVRKTLQEGGVPNPHVDAVMTQLKDPTFQFSGAEAGKTLQTAIQAQAETLEGYVRQSADSADKALNTRLSNVDAIIDKNPPGALADDVSAMIKNAKKQFSDTASGLYSKIDSMLGGTQVVPTEGIRDAARQIASQLPQTSVSAIVKEMTQLAGKPVLAEDAVLMKEFGIEIPGNKITLKDAQRIRTILREKGDAGALTRSVTKGDHLFLAQATDKAIQDAAQDPAASTAIAALNKADTFYRDGIRKFQDTSFKQLVKATKSGMPPDPEKIVSMIAVTGQSSRIEQLRKVVGEDVWKRVQAQDLSNLLKYTSSMGEQGTRVVDGMKLLEALKNRGASAVSVHGAEQIADLTELAKELAARKGILAPDALAQGDIRGALATLRTNERRLDDYLKTNLLAELADPRKTPEDVYRWVVTPGAESRVLEVARQFGTNSQQMAEIRQAALEELTRNANLKAIDQKGNAALTDALSSFTAKQQELLFPGGLADDIRKLGDTIKFIYPFKSGVARDVGMAGMHAGAVLEQPLRQRLYKQAVAGVTRMIALHPTVARWIVTGRDPNTPWIQNAARIIEGMTKMETMDAASEPQSGQ